MNIAILMDYDNSRPIGRLVEKDGGLFVYFFEGVRITRNMFFDIFGGAEAKYLDYDIGDDGNITTVRAAQILSFSLPKGD